VAAQLSHLTPDLVNRRYPDVEILLSQELVEKFFKALAYPFAPETELPHSLYTCLKEGEFKIFDDLGVELHQLLHVSQSFTYHSHLRLGDRVTSRASIQKINSRKLGGSLVVFLELRNQFLRKGELIAEASGSVIVRESK
jgi:hypothetical protein